MVWLYWLPESKKWVLAQNQEQKVFDNKWSKIKTGLKANVEQFSMITKSKPVLKNCIILVLFYFVRPDLLIRIQMLIWSTAPLCWMVISFSVGELFGNIFLNNAILGVVEVSATFISMSIQKYLPRQILMFLCFLFLGLFLLTSTVLRGFYYDETRVADVVVMIFAKFFASS